MTLPFSQGEKKHVGGFPLKSNGGVPLKAGSGGGLWQAPVLVLIPPAMMMPLRWWPCPALVTCWPEMLQGGAPGEAPDGGVALAAIGVAMASAAAAARIRATPRPRRLGALLVVSSWSLCGRPGLPGPGCLRALPSRWRMKRSPLVDGHR